MKKVLLVNPPVLKNEVYGKLGAMGSSAYPLGLCSLAAVLRKADFKVEIFDPCILGINLKDATDTILRINPDYLGLTAVTITIERAAQLAKEVKDRKKNIPVIIGGPHLTATPEETLLRYPCFDIGVIGEGEITVVELLTKMEKGADLSLVQGLIFRDNSSIKKTAARSFIGNLDDLPLPAWDLLPSLPKYYYPTISSLNRLPSTHLVTSRGCPGRCIFCDTSVFGRKYRFFSSNYVIKMVNKLYHNYGIRDILFDDDLFVGDKRRLIEICNMLISERLNLSWSCNARIDMIDSEMLTIMKKAGCWQIAYGIESGSQKILNSIGKNTNLKQIEEVLRLTSYLNIKTKGYFMMGYPNETKEDILETIKFAKKIYLQDFQISFFTPFPGSKIQGANVALKEKPENWGSFNTYTEPKFIPEGLNKENLIELNRIAFKEFYLRPKIIFSYLGRPGIWINIFKLLKGVYALLKMS